MPKMMRLGWYAGISAALAGGVVASAFHQRANFYSATVYLAQSNFCLLTLINFSLLLYSSFIYGLTRLCFGTLRAVEVEQLTERAWFAITETCLAMTIFREEIGAWFLVMFTALVTGKVWGWIGDGRVEFLEQQPPQNPRLFHARLSISLTTSFLYDIWILRYIVHNVIQQARPNMMVMFLFEFAVLATNSWRTAARYILVLTEKNIIKSQTHQRLMERRREIRERRETMIQRREQAAAAGEETSADDEALSSEDDVDEMDVEVPGWSAKGEWVLWLDLLSDMIKLGIYVAFFFMLLIFYGLPIHIMRDLFMTSRDFVKRLHALLRYRRAIQEMNRYPDATADELAQENTCIICREEMRTWDPVENAGTIDRVRPKKLPCGHILHLGCLKSWLERQQVCPTCRSPVTADRTRGIQNEAVGLRIQFDGQARRHGQQAMGDNEDAPGGQGRQNHAPRQRARTGGPRIFNLGPIRLGFGANDQQVRELAQQFGMRQAADDHATAASARSATDSSQPSLSENLHNIIHLIQQSEQMVRRDMQRLNVAQQELQILNLLMTELQVLQQRQQQAMQNQPQGAQPHQQGQAPNAAGLQLPLLPLHHVQMAAVQGPAQFPGQPIFAGVPVRSGSPLLARLGATGSAETMPAGSTDFPEGLTLPPGWSMMPLQRLDGAPAQSQAQAQAPGQTDLHPPRASRKANEETVPTTHGSNHTEEQMEQAAPSPMPVQDALTAPSPEEQPEILHHNARAVEQSSVVTPRPVRPSSSGPIQALSGVPYVWPHEGRGPQRAQPEPGDQPRDMSLANTGTARGTDESSVASGMDCEKKVLDEHQDEGKPGPSRKGKGKAATVEDFYGDGES